MSAKNIVSSDLSKRYAAAIFELADEKRLVDKVAKDLQSIDNAIGASNDLAHLINSPVIKRKDQKLVMEALLSKMGANALTKNFVGVVGQNRRLRILPEIFVRFASLVSQKRGELTAEVTSATKLTKNQVDEITKILGRVMGKRISLAQTIDKDILGGLVIKIGSRMIDSSLRTKINKLRFAMKGVG